MDDCKIYFAASIRGGRQDSEIYQQLIDYLGKYGKVLTEHIGDKGLALMGEDNMPDSYIHDRDVEWLTDSHKVVAEVTTASLGVGYELGRMVERNRWVGEGEKKPILCLYRPSINKKLSAMIAGCAGVVTKEYRTFDEAAKHIDEFFKN
jgi:2'-deoxynucleoside 5'-phosphate N-hydrolase